MSAEAPPALPRIALKELNNPFPKQSTGLPLVAVSLSFSAHSLPSRTWRLGRGFSLTWEAVAGGVVSLRHGSEPERVLWSSIPFRGFVSAAMAEAAVEESRGSFGIHDKVLLTLRHQTVESIHCTARRSGKAGEGEEEKGAESLDEWEMGREGSGGPAIDVDERRGELAGMAPAVNGRENMDVSGISDNSRMTKEEHSNWSVEAVGGGSEEHSDVHSVNSVVFCGILCSTFQAARGRHKSLLRRVSSRENAATTVRRRGRFYAFRPRVLLGRLRNFGRLPAPPAAARAKAAAGVSVRYTLTFKEVGNHLVGFSIRLGMPFIDGAENAEVGDVKAGLKRLREGGGGEGGGGGGEDAEAETEEVNCRGDEPKRQKNAPVEGAFKGAKELALENESSLPSTAPEGRIERKGRASLSVRVPSTSSLLPHPSSPIPDASYTEENVPIMGANLGFELRSGIGSDPSMATAIPSTPGGGMHRVTPRWLWWRRQLAQGSSRVAPTDGGAEEGLRDRRVGLIGRIQRWRRRDMARKERIRPILKRLQDMGRSLEMNRVQITYASNHLERFFGLGEQFSFFDFKGRRVPILVQEQGIGRGDQPITWAANLASHRGGGNCFTTYAPVPQYITSEMRCMYLEGYEYSIFDLRRRDRVQIQVHGGHLNGRIVHGSSPSELITRYTEAVGRMRALPEWIHRGAVVGMQGGTDAVRTVMERLIENGTPVSAFWLQDWCGQRSTAIGRQLWWNWELDEEHYAKWQNLVGDLGRRNIKVMGYINPYLVDVKDKPFSRRNLFNEAVSNGYAITTTGGKPYMMENTCFQAAMVDLTNPKLREWLKSIIRNMVNIGIRGWMADFSEALPFDACLYSGEDPSSAHNMYPEWWAQINREVVEEIEAEARESRRRAREVRLLRLRMLSEGEESAGFGDEIGNVGGAVMADVGEVGGQGGRDAMVEDEEEERKSIGAAMVEDESGHERGERISNNWAGNCGAEGEGKRDSPAVGAADQGGGSKRVESMADRLTSAMQEEEERETIAEDEEKLLFFTRAGFRNSPKHCTLLWEGDQMVSWQRHDGIKSAVTGLLSSGLAGFAFNHSDIGGYTTVPHAWICYRRNEELLQRWMELNAFTVVFRTHEGNLPSANVHFYSNDRMYAHFNRLARIFKAWGFYRSKLVKEAAETGMPVVRHMFLHYPQDREVMKIIYQQFLVGTDLLVAPVLDPGSTRVIVYFPPGERWVHVWTGAVYGEGGGRRRRVRVGAPIGQPAVFYRQGAETGLQFLANLKAEGVL